MPIYPHCAMKRKDMLEMSLMMDYAFMWFIAGFPAGVLPITKVQQNEQFFKDSHNDEHTDLLNDHCKDSAGMPICLQVVGYLDRDEHVLGIMKMLE